MQPSIIAQVYKPERLIAADHGENICLMHQMKDILSGNAAMESDAAGDSQGGGLLLQGVSLIAGTDNVQRPGPVHKARQRFQNSICVFRTISPPT